MKSTVLLYRPTSSSQWRNYHQTTSAVYIYYNVRQGFGIDHHPVDISIHLLRPK